MVERLPSLTAVRAFDAAARHRSITLAAAELHVTQAAVSHQIKGLEEHLGVALFRRHSRGLELTEAGRMYAEPVRQGFELLEEAGRRLKRRLRPDRLVVTVLPSFAAAWLVPRLGRFMRRHPEITIHLAPTADLVDFDRDDVDIGIRYGLGNYPGLEVVRLMDEDLFPVCSPALVAGEAPLHEPADLSRVTLLHDDGHGQWRTWLEAAGVDGVDPTRGPVLTDSNMVVQAAIEGHGVALARSGLTRTALREGRLVRPFDLSLPSRFTYYLVYPGRYAERADVQAFERWLLDEIAVDGDAGQAEPGE
jgi:LysR family glycine cleavage system transcriptional activator